MSVNLSSRRPARVLLVDDQLLVAEALRRQLQEYADVTLQHCQDSASVFRVIAEFKPTLILQDLVMPGKNGIDLLKEYRENSETRDLPVILLSSTEAGQTKYEAFAAGANDYIVKFPDSIELLGRIRCHSDSFHNLKERDYAQAESARRAVELQKRSKLESIGRLSESLAHELNTPAQYIANNLSFIQESMQTLLQAGSQDQIADLSFIKAEAPIAIADSIAGIEQISAVVRAMYAYCKIDQSHSQIINFEQLVADAFLLAQSKARGVAELKMRIEAGLPAVKGSQLDLMQALLALVINSCESIPGSGAGEQTGKIEVSIQSGSGCILLHVCDNGTGVAEGIREKIFDPFFSTKEVGQGLGQGLTKARSIIEEGHAGELMLTDNRPGHTVFTVKLPAAEN